jgi:hypothetical protein
MGGSYGKLVFIKLKEVSYRRGDHGYPSVIWRQKHEITFRPKRSSPLRTISLKGADIEVFESKQNELDAVQLNTLDQ